MKVEIGTAPLFLELVEVACDGWGGEAKGVCDIMVGVPGLAQNEQPSLLGRGAGYHTQGQLEKGFPRIMIWPRRVQHEPQKEQDEGQT